MMRFSRLLSALLVIVSLQAPLCINMDSGALMIAEDGTTYAAPGVYSQIYPLGDTGFYALREKESGYCILTDRLGNPMTEPVYDDAKMCGEHILLRNNGRWALFDSALNMLTDWSYTAVFPAEDRFFAFRTNLWDDKADELYLLDSLGTERATGVLLLYTDLLSTEGRCACVSAETGRYGYVDADANWVLSPEYVWAGEYRCGLAVLSTQEGSGVIDLKGNWVLEPVYERLALSEKYVLCREKGAAEPTVYRRAPEGLDRIENLPEGNAAQIGNYLAVYSGDYVYLFSSAGETAAIFAGDTLLYEGIGGQIIASDRNGMYVYDPVHLRMSRFFQALNGLKNSQLYLFSEPGKDGVMRVGLLTTEFETLFEAVYDDVAIPQEDVVALNQGTLVTVYSIRDGQPVLLVQTELSQ